MITFWKKVRRSATKVTKPSRQWYAHKINLEKRLEQTRKKRALAHAYRDVRYCKNWGCIVGARRIVFFMWMCMHLFRNVIALDFHGKCIRDFYFTLWFFLLWECPSVSGEFARLLHLLCSSKLTFGKNLLYCNFVANLFLFSLKIWISL